LLLYQPYPYVNASQDKTSGVDVDMKARLWDTAEAGRLTAELNYTHVIQFDLLAYGVTYDLAGTHGPSGVSGDTGNPKDRASLSLTWDRGPASVTGTLNYIGSFSITDPSATNQGTCAGALVSNLTLEYFVKFVSSANVPTQYCTVASFTDVDLYGRYIIGNNLQLHASVLNVFNTPPPLDVVTYGGGGGAAYDAAMHQAGAVGRFYTVGLTYKFQ
ncbi:MAG TPA: TonB-dependent receptor, partial [Steroidobacteraceae bacterium]|nr:TonB-dependent receptor [Steroidobacteraceae bacterium]